MERQSLARNIALALIHRRLALTVGHRFRNFMLSPDGLKQGLEAHRVTSDLCVLQGSEVVPEMDKMREQVTHGGGMGQPRPDHAKGCIIREKPVAVLCDVVFCSIQSTASTQYPVTLA